MKRILIIVHLILSFTSMAQDPLVRVERINSQWELLVDGNPYYIKGGGGTVKMQELKAAGGNTIRTWGLENAQAILDEAQSLGLKVMLGMWVQHERHGFDYNDSDKIANQLENFRIAVRKYKNHPALLMWGVGNEYELEYSNTKVWAAVNDIAKMVHEEDKNHPTATVTAGVTPEKLKFIMDVMTDVDIYGINTYGDIENVKKILSDGNFQGPYMITEWGPNGHWESPKTKWNSSVEQTSTEKAAVYLSRYQRCISAERKQCIGSFAFLWGQKQEYTNTWYGLFAENGQPTEPIDQLEFCWSGKYPINRSPSVDSMHFNHSNPPQNIICSADKKYPVSVFAHDLNRDKLTIKWELFPESTDLKSGGDAEAKPTSLVGKIKRKDATSIFLQAPKLEGRYRLFVSVSDGEKTAYSNLPFYVQLDTTQNSNKVTFKKQTLHSFDEK